ncbi:MAG: filamentation induced by cAMP protein Fic [Rubritepida sp.]|nr:filamentation induced by cAMP protein Fic [Rubritepida sp.]
MDRSALSAKVRSRLERLPPPYSHAYGVVPLPPPTGVLNLLPVLPQLHAAVAALERVQTLAKALRSSYLVNRVLPRREAVSSSAMEGTYSTLDELLNTEEASETEESAGADLQVREYALALEALLPRAEAEGSGIFTEQEIRDLHRRVMRHDGDYQDIPGELRQRVVWIGGSPDISRSTFNPPPPARIAECLADSLRYLRQEDDPDTRQQSIVTRMAVAHAHFEAVHPFRDGNGRVGRLLLPLMMAAEGMIPIYLSPYIEAHRSAYIEALKAAQQRLEWHVMVGFMADAVCGTVDDLLVMQAELEALRSAWESRRPFRGMSAASRALDVLPSYPVLTIRRLSALLNVTFPAASTAIAQLREAGILRERTGYARNRIYVAPEVLAIMGSRQGR